MTTFMDWPVDTPRQALQMAQNVADDAAQRIASDLIELTEELLAADERAWLNCYDPEHFDPLYDDVNGAMPCLARFVASQGAIPGEAAYRWAAAQGFHSEAADAWSSQPAAVRLPFEVFVCTFLAVHALLLEHLRGRDIARAAEQQAELVRVPVEATIFETGAEASDRYDMGPVGTYTPVLPDAAKALEAIGLAVVSDEVPLTLTEPAQTDQADQVEPDDLADVPLPTADEPAADTGAGSSALSPPAKKGRKG
jgi:hypothetical protein